MERSISAIPPIIPHQVNSIKRIRTVYDVGERFFNAPHDAVARSEPASADFLVEFQVRRGEGNPVITVVQHPLPRSFL